jgi:hypothetical protein
MGQPHIKTFNCEIMHIQICMMRGVMRYHRHLYYKMSERIEPTLQL